MFNYQGIPEHMREGLELYVTHGVSPGSFMMSLLCNDLKEACARADNINRHHIWNFANCFYNEIPIQAWGSPEKVNEWIGHQGMKGDVSE